MSCNDNRKIKYSGFNDLVVGSNTVKLYENGEFNIELGLGYNSGTYQIKNDTAFLTYANPEIPSTKIQIKENELIVLNNSKRTIVRRIDNLNSVELKSKDKRITELSIPIKLTLTSRMKVVDGSTDSNLNYCEGQIRKYSEMGEYDCSFTIESVVYNLRSKFVYDSTQLIKSYWSYKSEGPLIYSSEDILNDQKFTMSIGADKIPIRLNNSIVYGADTMQIKSINEKYKLIFMEKNRNEKFRIIYEYK